MPRGACRQLHRFAVDLCRNAMQGLRDISGLGKAEHFCIYLPLPTWFFLSVSLHVHHIGMSCVHIHYCLKVLALRFRSENVSIARSVAVCSSFFCFSVQCKILGSHRAANGWISGAVQTLQLSVKTLGSVVRDFTDDYVTRISLPTKVCLSVMSE